MHSDFTQPKFPKPCHGGRCNLSGDGLGVRTQGGYSAFPDREFEVFIDKKNTATWKILHVFYIKNHLRFQAWFRGKSLTLYFYLINVLTS